MLKILLQNIFLPYGNLFLTFFILILNILKDPKILSLISLPMNFCSAAMATRRLKDKHPTTKTTKALVKKEPASPVDIANHFIPLGTIPKPNYSSVLASPYDPYAMVPARHPVKPTFSRNPNA